MAKVVATQLETIRKLLDADDRSASKEELTDSEKKDARFFYELEVKSWKIQKTAAERKAVELKVCFPFDVNEKFREWHSAVVNASASDGVSYLFDSNYTNKEFSFLRGLKIVGENFGVR